MERITHFIWTDIDPEEEAGFNAWYRGEHMPDRVLRVPGFTRGRRFRAFRGGPQYLAYYEMEDAKVFWSPEYVAIRAEPDPKSRHYVARFRNAVRSTSSIHCELDRGEGAYLGIAGLLGAETARIAQSLKSLSLPGDGTVSRVRLSRTLGDMIEQNYLRLEQKDRGSLRPRDRVVDWILTVEGDHLPAVSGQLSHLLEGAGLTASVITRSDMELDFACSPARANTRSYAN